MAKSVVGFELNVNSSQAEGSVKSLKAQLREAQADVQMLSEKFGETSQEAINAAKRAAELKDAIGDAKALTDAFNPDRKFQAFSSAIQGVVGGFAALQGAQALFGSESEELEKVLVKVQAAMALSQGINSIMEAKDSFKILSTVIKTNVVGAFSSMKAAIASTGIGLLIIGVGLLIEKFMSMGDAAEEAAAAQDKLNESTKRYADIGLKAEQSFLERQEKLELAREKLAGKSEDEIFNIQQKYRTLKLKSQERYYNEIKDADSNAAFETLTTIKNGIAEGEAAELEHQAKLKEINDNAAKEKLQKIRDNAQKEREAINQANEKAIEETKALNDEIALLQIKNDDERAKAKLKQDYDNKLIEIEQSKANEEIKSKELLALKQKYEIDLATLENDIKDKKLKADLEKQNQIDKALSDARLAAITDENFKKQTLIDIQRDEEIQKQADAYNQGLIDLQTYNNAVAGINAEFDKQQADLVKQIQDKRAADEKAAADERIRIAQAEAQSKIQLAQSVGSALGELSNLVGSQTALGKGLALAQIAIDTGLAISALTKNSQANPANAVTGGIAGAIQFATGIAQIIANIAKAKQILSTANVPAKGGGGGSAPSVSAPLTPQLQVQNTQLNQGQVNQMASATARAFVLESDVSGSQERIQRINRAARIN